MHYKITHFILTWSLTATLMIQSAVAQETGKSSVNLEQTKALLDKCDELYSSGHYAEALPIFLRLLPRVEKLYGGNDTATATVLSMLANSYGAMGEYAKALPLKKRALAISEKANGPEHPNTGVALSNLSATYLDMGEYAMALPLQERALTISEKANGPEHPTTGAALINLAAIYSEMGEYAKALPLQERALAISEKSNGPEHPNTGVDLMNLAVTYSGMGGYAKALPLEERALAISEKSNGPEHPTTGGALINLACLYREMGEYAKALPLQERALAISEKANGPEHPTTGKSLMNLAATYLDMGEYAKALPLQERALAISEKSNGPEHPTTGAALMNLAATYSEMGEYAKALPLEERALAISEKSNGPEHPNTGVDLMNLTATYSKMGEYAKALPLEERALAINEKANGPEHPTTGAALMNLAFLYREMGEYAKALPLEERALAINEKVLGPQHPRTSSSLNNLAEIYLKIGDLISARGMTSRWILSIETQLQPMLTLGETQRLAWAKENISFSLPAASLKAEKLDELILRWKGIVIDSLLEDRALAMHLGSSKQGKSALAQIQSMKSQIAKLSSVAGKIDSDKIQQLQQQIDTLESSLGNSVNLGGRVRSSSQTTVDQLCATIGKGDVVVDIITYMNQSTNVCYGVSVVCRDSDPKWVPIEGAKEINNVLDGVRRAIVVNDEVSLKAGMNILYDKLWKPIAESLPSDAKKLYIGADGPLNFLSFATLLDEKDRFLCEKYQIAYVGSGRDLLRDTMPINNKNFVIYANPIFSSGERATIVAVDSNTIHPPRMRAVELKEFAKVQLPQLPGTEQEAATLSQIVKDAHWSDESHLGTDATKKNLMTMKAPAILHLATHGFFLSEKSDGTEGQRGMKVVAASNNSSVQNTIKGGIGAGLKVSGEFKIVDFLVPDSPALKSGLKQFDRILKINEQVTKDLSKQQVIDLIRGDPETTVTLSIQRNGELQPLVISIKRAPIVVQQAEDHSSINPMRQSGIALTGGQNTLQAWGRGEFPDPDDDGILTAEEVSGLDLNGTWIVTLSACETGIGEARSGEGVFGLRRAFMMAGAQNLLMTLWPVSDEVTPKIMADFYKEALASRDAAGTLSNVQRDWLVKLRKEKGLLAAVRDAGPFVMATTGKSSVSDPKIDTVPVPQASP